MPSSLFLRVAVAVRLYFSRCTAALIYGVTQGSGKVRGWFRRARLVAGQTRQWKLGRVLPGQRKGSQRWFHQLSGDAAEELESMEEVPTLFRAWAGNFAAQIHVDDITSTGAPEIQAKIDPGEAGEQVPVNRPFFEPGEVYEFLRRRHQLEPDGSITIRAATRFYLDLYELAGRPKTRTTPGPSGKEDMFDLDNTKALDSGEATLFRTMLGKLLYMSAERPDCQAAIQYLSGKASAPTERALKLLRPRAPPSQRGYSGTPYRRLLRQQLRQRPNHTQKPVLGTDLRWPGPRLLFCSGTEGGDFKAELVALTQTTSESILVKKAWEFLVREPTTLVMRSNSSVARAIASRLGVGRVRHLQTSCLCVQQWVAQHLLKVLPVPTEFNPADLGTKCFTARRLRLLCYLVGMVEDNGDHVGHNEFREALARRGTQDRNRELLVRLVQLLAATSLQGCEFSPASPDNFFEDAAALIYFTILVFMRYLWLVILVLVVWTVARRVGSNDPEANPRTHKDKGKTSGTSRAMARSRRPRTTTARTASRRTRTPTTTCRTRPPTATCQSKCWEASRKVGSRGGCKDPGLVGRERAPDAQRRGAQSRA